MAALTSADGACGMAKSWTAVGELPLCDASVMSGTAMLGMSKDHRVNWSPSALGCSICNIEEYNTRGHTIYIINREHVFMETNQLSKETN